MISFNIIIVFNMLFLMCMSTLTNAAMLVGHVVGVADGDTITLLDASQTQYKIRLAGIDAPEKKQAFGQASKQSLSDLVYDKVVTVDWQKKDRYGRIVGKVLVKDTDVNLVQLQRGMAWFYKKYQNELKLDDRLSYLNAHEIAEKERVGLWGNDNIVAPWDFRR